MKPKIKHRKLSKGGSPELKALSYLVGQFIEYWGFKSVQGRIWLYLFVSKEPLSSIDLSKLVGISPALVTQSVQVLIRYKVILKAPKGANGVLKYEANPMPEEAIRLVLKSRELPLLLKTETASKKAQKQTPKNKPKNNRDAFNAAPERLQKVEAWCTLFRTVLETGILLLAQPENPFSAPNEKFWEK